MRFLVDAQLPPALARWLAAKGHEAEHVGDKGMQAASDAAIWDHALASSSAIITKDEDFAQRKALATAGPAVVWMPCPLPIGPQRPSGTLLPRGPADNPADWLLRFSC